MTIATFDRIPASTLRKLARKDPQLYALIEDRIGRKEVKDERERCEESLLTFFKRAWREISPATLSVNWHHIEIIKHLEAVAYGATRDLIINIPPRHTKALDCETPVLTTWGWKLHGDLKVDDYVFGPDGKPKKVIGISARSQKPSSAISWDDGSSIVASDDHLWVVERDYPYGGKGSTRIRRSTSTTTSELIVPIPGRSPRSPQHCDRIPLASAVEFPPRRFLIDPYLLGAWLGDGHTDSAYLTVGQEDIEHFRHLGVVVRQDDRNGDGRLVYRLGLRDGVQRKLRVLGILGNKHIPDDYLEASVEQRWALLQGLMDTDGSATADGFCVIVSKLEHLADQIGMLLCSLGLKPHKREAWTTLGSKKHGPYHEIRFTPPEGITIFRLERKQRRIEGRIRNARSLNRYIASVVPVGPREVNCIEVEGSIYLAGKQLIATHNTLLCNVIFPAWLWTQERDPDFPLLGPQVSFLCVSYGATLSEEIALKMRRLVQGDWYQRLWGFRVKLRDDQQSRANFATTAGGERLSNSIEGGILGRGAELQLVDDPQTRKGADSDAERAASLAGMSDLSTRIGDPRISAKILIMQRLHTNDATDWAIKNWPSNTVHLMYPARFDPSRACQGDPRRYEGELLWPEVWNEEELTKIERGLSALDGEVLSDYAVSGQLQQMPVPRGGGIVNRDDWRIWPEFTPRLDDLTITKSGYAFIALPAVSHVLVSLDTALSERETADWNACVVWGIWHRPRHLTQIVGHEEALDDGEQPRAIMMGAWRRRCKLNDDTLEPDGMPRGLVQRVIATCRRFGADRLVIENKTRGLDVKNEIERQIMDQPFQIELFEPGRHGDKVARLHSVQPLFSQGLVYAPANCRLGTDKTGNEYVDVQEFEWARLVMSEIEAVPKGAHDDLADACLVAGTLIATRKGPVPIEKVRIGDQVLTPLGWRGVTAAGCTGEHPVMSARGITGTANHPVFTLELGYQPLDTVSQGLTVSRLSLCGLIRLILLKPSTSSASPIAAWGASVDTTSLNQPAMPAESRPKGFMWRFGRQRTDAPCRKGARSITKTATRLISMMITLSAYRSVCIVASLRRSAKKRLNEWSKVWPWLARRLRFGTLQRKDWNGIDNTQHGQSTRPVWRFLIQISNLMRSSVLGAAGVFSSRVIALNFVREWFARQQSRNTGAAFAGPSIPITQRSTVFRSTLSAPVVTKGLNRRPDGEPQNIVAPNAGRQQPVPVYNLSVDEAQCYYANGVLVHNCVQGLIVLRTGGFMALTQEYIAEQVRKRMFRRRPRSVREGYGV